LKVKEIINAVEIKNSEFVKIFFRTLEIELLIKVILKSTIIKANMIRKNTLTEVSFPKIMFSITHSMIKPLIIAQNKCLKFLKAFCLLRKYTINREAAKT
jgi:hypothetical protein